VPAASAATKTTAAREAKAGMLEAEKNAWQAAATKASTDKAAWEAKSVALAAQWAAEKAITEKIASEKAAWEAKAVAVAVAEQLTAKKAKTPRAASEKAAWEAKAVAEQLTAEKAAVERITAEKAAAVQEAAEQIKQLNESQNQLLEFEQESYKYKSTIHEKTKKMNVRLNMLKSECESMSIRNSEAFASDDFTTSRLSMGICNGEIACVLILQSEKEENDAFACPCLAFVWKSDPRTGRNSNLRGGLRSTFDRVE